MYVLLTTAHASGSYSINSFKIYSFNIITGRYIVSVFDLFFLSLSLIQISWLLFSLSFWRQCLLDRPCSPGACNSPLSPAQCYCSTRSGKKFCWSGNLTKSSPSSSEFIVNITEQKLYWSSPIKTMGRNTIVWPPEREWFTSSLPFHHPQGIET